MVWCYKKQQEEFLMWVEEFNKLRKNIFINKRKLENIVAFMDLHIFKGDKFYGGKTDHQSLSKTGK